MPWCGLLSYFHNHEPRNIGQGIVRWSLAWCESQDTWMKLDRSSQQLGLWASPPDVHRVRLTLPLSCAEKQHAWFRALLARSCPDIAAMTANLKTLPGVLLVAVVKLSAVFHYQGPLTDLSREQKLLWEFFRWPADATFWNTDEVYVLDEPLHVEKHVFQGWDKIISKNPGLCQVFFALDKVYAKNGHRRCSLQELLQDLQEPTLPCVLLPCELNALICARAWSDLCILARWGGRLLQEWPDEHWQLQSANRHVRASAYWEFMERSEAGRLFEARWFTHLASELRRFATELPHEQANLEGLVQWIDDCAESLEGTAYKTWSWNADEGGEALAVQRHARARVGQAWMCKALVSAFMASRYLSLKCGEHIRAILSFAAPFLPPGLGSYLQHASVEVPSRSTLQRCQLVCDIALMLQRQGANDASLWAQRATYLWWDASVPLCM